MQDQAVEDLRAAIAALASQRATLGDAVLEMATAPLRTRLAALLRPAGLKHRLVTVLSPTWWAPPPWPTAWTPRTRWAC